MINYQVHVENNNDDETNVGETDGISYQLTRKLSADFLQGPGQRADGRRAAGWQKNDCQ